MFDVLTKKKLGDKVWLMDVYAPLIAAKAMPGQFMILRCDADGERIPLTVCDYDRDSGRVTIVFQTVGAETERFSRLEEGDCFADIVGPLGNPSDLCDLPVEELTDDGSYGIHGNVCTALQQLWDEGVRYDHCVVIGPVIMMKFACQLTKKLGIPTVISMNTIMVDGTGMCGACRLLVGGEVKFACVDGPEFDGWEVDFDQALQRSRLYKTEEGRLMLKLQEGDTHSGHCGVCS